MSLQDAIKVVIAWLTGQTKPTTWELIQAFLVVFKALSEYFTANPTSYASTINMAVVSNSEVANELDAICQSMSGPHTLASPAIPPWLLPKLSELVWKYIVERLFA